MEKKQLNDKNCLIGKTFLFFINYEKMLSANLQFVQMVALALRLHWFGGCPKSIFSVIFGLDPKI